LKESKNAVLKLATRYEELGNPENTEIVFITKEEQGIFFKHSLSDLTGFRNFGDCSLCQVVGRIERTIGSCKNCAYSVYPYIETQFPCGSTPFYAIIDGATDLSTLKRALLKRAKWMKRFIAKIEKEGV